MPDPQDSENRSTYFQEFLAEREEILRHKWLKSQELGRDIGLEAALLDWTTHHRSAWKKAQSKRGVAADH